MGRDSPGKRTPRDLHEEKMVECPKCHDIFLHQRSLDRHLRVEHGPRVFFWCRQCSHKNNRRDNLRAHYKDCHPNHEGEVSKIQAESYEARELSRRPRSEMEGHRSKERATPSGKDTRHEAKKDGKEKLESKREAKSHSAGRSEDKPSTSTKKRSREKSEGDKSSKKRPREVKAPSTISRAPDEGETPVSAGVREQKCLERKQNAGSKVPTAEDESSTAVEVGSQSGMEAMEPPEFAEELVIATANDSGVEGGPEIALSATPDLSMWDPDETSHPREQSAAGGGKPLSLLRFIQEVEGCDRKEGVEEDKHLPIPDATLCLEKLLPGQVVRVREVKETYYFRDGDKTLRGETQREYDVVYLRPTKVKMRSPTRGEGSATTPQTGGRLCRLIKIDGEHTGAPYSDDDLVEAMVGRVNRVVETSTREMYLGGNRLTKDKTKRVIDVDFVAGVAKDP